MTRPIARIKPILKIIEEAWLRQPDTRLWQLLENAWVNWNTEDLTDFVSQMHKTYWTTPLLWWTYWVIWKSKLKYLPLEELEVTHMANIIDTQPQISPYVKDLLQKEIIKRI